MDLEQDPRSIIGSRVFNVPRDLVFSAFTDPEHLARWWGPTGFTLTTHAFDFRPGGVWRFVMHGPDGRDYQNRVTYHHGGGDDVEPVKFETTVAFEDIGKGQTRIIWHGTFQSAAERARVIEEYGADKRLVETLARLAGHLATLVAK